MEYTEEQIEAVIKAIGLEFNAWMFDQSTTPEVGEIEDWFLDRIASLIATPCTV